MSVAEEIYKYAVLCNAKRAEKEVEWIGRLMNEAAEDGETTIFLPTHKFDFITQTIKTLRSTEMGFTVGKCFPDGDLGISCHPNTKFPYDEYDEENPQ